MLRNVNQVCGVLALIAIGCLVVFGSTDNRIVTAAPGQIGQAGDTGTALAIGGCNRCAWRVRPVEVTLPFGGEYEIFPRGSSGVIGGATFQLRLRADCFEPGNANVLIFPPPISGCGTYLLPEDRNGTRFVDGLVMVNNFSAEPYSIRCTVSYRLDENNACNRCAWNLKYVETVIPAGTEYEILPRGESGTIRWAQDLHIIRADCFESGALGIISSTGLPAWNCDMFYNNDQAGIRFINGLVFSNIFDPPGDFLLRTSVFYRLD